MVDSHISEASALVVQEEEDRLILEKNPLQQKLVEIIGKYGLKSISNDVERCLSLCVEERLRGLIRNLVRLSKQRLDTEKPRHKIVITSDISQQIMLINRKAQEESEKNLAEVEKLQKLNEATGNTRVDGKKEKDEDCGNRKQDNNMFTKAANVAARAAVGGVDMLSKWQLMAEQAKKKREEGIVAASGLQPGGQKLSSSRSSKDNHKMETRGHSAANSIPVREAGRMQAVGAHSEDAHTISVRDVVAALEREPQMSKSTFLYQLYEKLP
ncbi:hypothetical protein ACH5RR_001824 [Cinchona calisaya]|uniref:Transcription initiation factor TFIID component TAF4 C-terminal domain-containing protein n=1 Tax=Cinchona calisaya TaxID=153742 RepID=A0ABD3B5B7_9GENT